MPKKIDFWQLARDNYNKKGLVTTFFLHTTRYYPLQNKLVTTFSHYT